jgi:hypothetical protein
VQRDLEEFAVTVEQTIPLRDIGRRLAPLRRSRDKVASDELLSLLQTGEISAGFRFSGRTIFWIKIPAHYWTKVSSNKFRNIRYSSKKKNSGAFKVRLGEFADDIVIQVNEQLETKKSDASNEWEAVLKATTRSYEVEITERVWADYLVRHNFTEPGPEIKSKSGRNQKKGWRELSIIISAYIIKHYETTKEEIKLEESSKKIHEIAKAEKIISLPAASTIKDELSKIRAKAETLSIK